MLPGVTDELLESRFGVPALADYHELAWLRGALGIHDDDGPLRERRRTAWISHGLADDSQCKGMPAHLCVGRDPTFRVAGLKVVDELVPVPGLYPGDQGHFAL